jgi:hypothetical protein
LATVNPLVSEGRKQRSTIHALGNASKPRHNNDPYVELQLQLLQQVSSLWHSAEPERPARSPEDKSFVRSGLSWNIDKSWGSAGGLVGSGRFERPTLRPRDARRFQGIHRFSLTINVSNKPGKSVFAQKASPRMEQIEFGHSRAAAVYWARNLSLRIARHVLPNAHRTVHDRGEDRSGSSISRLDGAKSAPRSVDVDFLPDNLRWTDHGTLLLAGPDARPEELFGCQARHEECPLGFTVAEIDPATLRVRVLFRGGDTTFGGATGALFVGRDLWVGSFRGETIGRLVPIAPREAQ